jgi:hypothetical protein
MTSIKVEKWGTASGEYVGFTKIAEIDWDNESYQFNVTGVWQKDDDLTLWYAEDSGCSCPVVWENTTELERLFSLEPIVQRLHSLYKNKHDDGYSSTSIPSWDDWETFSRPIREAFERLRRA